MPHILPIAPALAGLDVNSPLWKENFNFSQIENRVKELGLQKLINKDGTLNASSSHDYLKKLETVMWQKADIMKKGFFYNSETDLKNAFVFLELFAFYCGEKEILYSNEETKMEDTEKILIGNFNKNAEDEKKHKCEKRLNNLFKSLEQANESLSSEERMKVQLPRLLPRINNLINKLYSDSLSETDQRALKDKIKIAQDILIDFYK